jgi:hypothetical protein
LLILRSACSTYVTRRIAASVRLSLALVLLASGSLFVTAAVAQNTAPPPDAPAPAAQSAPAKPSAGKKPSAKAPMTEEERKAQREKAEEQLRQQEKQRILGVIPNFNTTNVQDAAPLSPGQKFRLAYRSAIDPFEFVAAGMLAGFGQATNNHAGYGQGFAGYSKRYGAAYADSADGVLWGNAVLPVLLHQDPRYFRMGHGSIKRRILYSLSTAVWTKNDNGSWGPNYSNVAGNFISGGISNLYYPPEDRGFELTFDGAVIVTAEGALGALGVEFWPDISRKLFHKRDNGKPAPAPK